MKTLRIIAIAGLALFAVWQLVSAVYVILVMDLQLHILGPNLIIAVLSGSGAWWLSRNPASDAPPGDAPSQHGPNNVLKILAIAIIGAIGLFTGGCSFIFLVPGQTYVPELQIPGFLIAAVCGLVVYGLARSLKDPPDQENPGEQG